MMIEPGTTKPTLADLKYFIRTMRKFKDFDVYVRDSERIELVFNWLREKSRGN